MTPGYTLNTANLDRSVLDSFHKFQSRGLLQLGLTCPIELQLEAVCTAPDQVVVIGSGIRNERRAGLREFVKICFCAGLWSARMRHYYGSHDVHRHPQPVSHQSRSQPVLPRRSISSG